tara:strand:+ start:65 stop:838 length:774 start_codon:yes stop_codon:yes gene_type:complete
MVSKNTSKNTTGTLLMGVSQQALNNFPFDPIPVPLEVRGVCVVDDEKTGNNNGRGRRAVVDLGSRVTAVVTFSGLGLRGLDALERRENDDDDDDDDGQLRRRRIGGETGENSSSNNNNNNKKKEEEKTLAIDLSIPTNPFFRYYAVVTESAFERMKEKQNITVNFDDGFLMTLKEQLIACRERESANVMCFTMNSTGSGTLVFIEDLGHKLVETLRIDFEQYDERDIQERVALEYREMARSLYGETDLAAPYAARRK